MKLQQAVSQKKLTLVEKRKRSHMLRISLEGLLRRCWTSMMLLHQIPSIVFTRDFWLGKLAIEETIDNDKRTITFSPILRERLGHHIHGEIWATNIKEVLKQNQLLDRPIHVISANMHSVMNSILPLRY
jgi:hypothetical protein